MSEHLNKKAVLEWLKKRLDETQFVREAHVLAEIIAKIECGRFDDDQTEVQRLRAALGHIHAIAQSELDVLQYESQRKTWEKILLTAEEALSTTEPTGTEGDGNE